jgi:hypothetical protein
MNFFITNTEKLHFIFFSAMAGVKRKQAPSTTEKKGESNFLFHKR